MRRLLQRKETEEFSLSRVLRWTLRTRFVPGKLNTLFHPSVGAEYTVECMRRGFGGTAGLRVHV